MEIGSFVIYNLNKKYYKKQTDIMGESKSGRKAKRSKREGE
jgi:hypothetical protein